MADEIASSTLNMDATRIRAAASVAISRSFIQDLLNTRGVLDARHYHEVGGRGHQPAGAGGLSVRASSPDRKVTTHVEVGLVPAVGLAADPAWTVKPVQPLVITDRLPDWYAAGNGVESGGAGVPAVDR
jgi:hypothetical protein